MTTRPNSFHPNKPAETLVGIAWVAGISEATLKTRPYLNETDLRRDRQQRDSGPYGKPFWWTMPNTAVFLEDRYQEAQRPHLHDVRAAAGQLGGFASGLARRPTACSTPTPL